MTGFWTPDAALSSPNSGVLIPGGFDEQALLGDGAFALKVPALPWDRRLSQATAWTSVPPVPPAGFLSEESGAQIQPVARDEQRHQQTDNAKNDNGLDRSTSTSVRNVREIALAIAAIFRLQFQPQGEETWMW
jgi:hypothetical protein